jgi:hypothetical protein
VTFGVSAFFGATVPGSGGIGPLRRDGRLSGSHAAGRTAPGTGGSPAWAASIWPAAPAWAGGITGDPGTGGSPA